MEIFFFGNGVQAVFDDKGEQVAELQKTPWVIMYANFLKSSGVDPLKVKFKLPSGDTGNFFEKENGEYGYEIKRE
jgi:hypothetical protein